ncbi:MAG TPA: aminotransferase class III-fold pyridoxal phosphate-dependent enzyme [Solirubrobacteraceae bacterium]|jgi:glutamate-1-semialdehyde aminotransferase|nr:aminotransferase class III-fold pyridoxal phosphate-dependent enzyme [Solirubrobacteraceae bacterium]
MTATGPGTAAEPAAAEIRERARRIADGPIRRPAPERLQAEVDEFRRRTSGSAELGRRAARVLARGTEHVDPLSFPYPLFMRAGAGSRVTDVDGNEYVDCVLAGGAILLGHNHPELNRRVVELIRERTNFHGHLDELEVEAGEELAEVFPSIEAVRFTASGAEANLAAARIARAWTGRSKLVKFRGAYHGWHDQFLVDIEVPGSGRFLAGGIPEAYQSETVLVSQNDLDELESVLAGGDVAAVFCEPVGAESGLVPFDEGYHPRAIELAHRHGALYVFDEVVTGFRVGLGGAQRLYGVEPDLTTLGKALMNGYPSCGAVGGRKEIVDTANVSVPDERPSAYVGGTLSGNVLSAGACVHAVRLMREPGVLDRAIDAAGDLVARLNALFAARGFDFFSYRFGSIVKTELTAPQAVPLDDPARLGEVLERRELLSAYMVPIQNAGVLSRLGRDMLSCAHTTEDNERTVAAYGRLLDVLE